MKKRWMGSLLLWGISALLVGTCCWPGLAFSAPTGGPWMGLIHKDIDSGSTISGDSTFVLRKWVTTEDLVDLYVNGTGVTFVSLGSIRSRVGSIQVSGVTPSLGFAPHHYDIPYVVGYRASNSIGDLDIAEKVPIVDTSSSDSDEWSARTFILPPTEYAQFYIEPSGVTPLGQGVILVYFAEGDVLPDRPALNTWNSVRWVVPATAVYNYGYVSGVTDGLVGDVPDGVRSAIVSVDAACRCTWDGATNPTTSFGHRLTADLSVKLSRDELKNLRIIAEAGTADLIISYSNKE